ncbi:DUF4012 domain-containing protein [Nitriliruptor alkaliphilus]|uniref:DUF4012 domain-containing protein n=1 Tax=Nitriliruptor alkaliphilus TaxID=427918 RepID=UPI0012EEE07D|nr:DUF4012 domain-containing protein [Nitriliruptor alkaliphilus]
MSEAVHDVDRDLDGPAVGRAPRRLVWAVLVTVVLLVVWAVVAGVLLLSAGRHLAAAQRALPAARQSLAAGDLDAGHEAIATLAAAGRAATRDLDALVVRPLRMAPLLGADVRAASAIARAGQDVGGAAEEFLDTLVGLPDGLGSLGPRDGRLPVDEIRALEPALSSVAEALASAKAHVDAEPGSGRLDVVTTARERVLELVDPLVASSANAADLARVLPSFLGADEPRTYLFGASTPAELRGTGGFIGSVSVLILDDGRPEFGTFTATSDLPVLPADALPPPVEEDAARWERYGGTGTWHGLHRTPDFPTAAIAMERLWATTEGTHVDGMIVADPFALAALLTLTGPVEDPRFGQLDADTVVDYVTNEAYAQLTDPDERKEVLGAVSAATFEAFLLRGTAPEHTRDVVDELGGLIAAGHLVLHSTDDDVQAALADAGAAGALGDPDGDLVNVVLNSGSASKVDYYAERRIEHTVTLLEGGASGNELTLTIGNDAPTSGQPKYIIGPNNPSLDAGDSLVDVSVYAARGASFTTTPPSEEGLPAATGTELGRSVHDGWVRLASGESRTRTYTWVTPDAWRITDDGLHYELLFQGQTVIRPTQVTLGIRMPDGTAPSALPEGANLVDDTVVWSGEVRGEDVHLQLRLERDTRPDPPGS